MPETVPSLRQVVLDTTDVRSLAEFYRRLLSLVYRPGDEPSEPDDRDWLVLRTAEGVPQLAFQQVESLPEATWPGDSVPRVYADPAGHPFCVFVV